MPTYTRRDMVVGAAALGFASRLTAASELPIIDTHTHFYDPMRPEGVPWPGKTDKVLYRTVLPTDFEKVARPVGVTGTVVVEASPRVEDNAWLLELAKKHPVVVGVVGRLIPKDADFAKNLARFSKDPKYRGIRINHDEVKAAMETPVQLDRIRLMSDSGLTLDVNGGPDLLPDAAKLADKLPKLSIVVNHLANPLIDGKEPPKAWLDGLSEAAKRPNVWCKLSALVDGTRQRDGKAPKEAAFYRPVMNAAWAAFGAEKLMFGSNWPVSDNYASYKTLYELAETYVKPKGEAAFARVFGGNAVKAYGLKTA